MSLPAQRGAVVTGASQGIAREIALQLAADGVAVLLCARRGDVLRSVVAEITARGGRASSVVADVATVEGVAEVVRAAADALPQVDILANVVGAMAVPTRKSTTDFSDDDWAANIDLNLMSAVRLCRAFVPGMVERGWGRVVNFSSLVGLEPEPVVAPYSAAKAAVLAYTKALSRSVAASGVTCNAIVPGLIHTPKIDGRLNELSAQLGRSPEELLQAELRRRPIPVGRTGRAEDIAPLVALLVSERGGFITGTRFVVDGGAYHGLT